MLQVLGLLGSWIFFHRISRWNTANTEQMSLICNESSVACWEDSWGSWRRNIPLHNKVKCWYFNMLEMCPPKRKKGGTFQDESNTCWWKYRSRAGAGQPSCNKEKWLIIRNCCIMHAEMLSGWLENSHSSKPIWLPVRGCGPYRIWIKRISQAEKQFHTDFTLNCQHGPSCVRGILITLTHNGKI